MVLARIILGLLSIAPMSGYDVKRHVDSTIRHFWSADKAQIYRTLARLVDDGLATVRVVPGSTAPDRVEHRITAAGRAALAEWLAGDLEPQPERDAFLARLFFAAELDDRELGALLERRRKRAQDLLAEFEALRAAAPAATDRGSRLRLATLDNGLAHVRAELDWLTELDGDLAR